MIDLDKLLDNGEEHARKILLEERHKSMMGIYHLVAPEGGTDRVIGVSWENDIEKQITVLSIKDVSREMKAVAALMIHEAWMLKLNRSTPNTSWHRDRLLANLPRPSESPDRIEVVHLIATDGRETKSRALQMVRDKPGGRLIALIEDKAMEGGEFSGRLIDGIITPPA